MSYTAVINGNTYIYEEELNDTSSRATAVGKYFGGDLINVSDIDWFSVTLPANSLIKVNFAAGNGQYGRWSTQYFDSKLNLVGASNFSISNLAGITSAETTFTTSSAGIYYFKIQAYDAGTFKSSSYWIGLDYVSPPIISAANSEISIKEGNTENPKVPVTLIFDKPSAFVTAIHFTVRSGTATAGAIYGSDLTGSLGGTLIVDAGSTTVTLPNTLILSDISPENDEYFWVDFDSISIGNAQFAGRASTLSVKVVIIDDDSPTYSLVASSPSINEGSVATFTLTTTNLTSGTSVPYSISGLSSADVSGGVLSGNAVINSSGIATISISLISDSFTEGDEPLTISAGGATASTVVNDTSKSTRAYSLSIGNTTVNEGEPVAFLLSTIGLVASGTSVPYVLSGISSSDIAGGQLSGNVVINSSGYSFIFVTLLNDSLTEGTETLTVTAGGASASIYVLDTSTSKKTGTENHNLSVVVDKGVLGPMPTLLKDLSETMVFANGMMTKHIIQYSGITFDYDLIDSLITTVTRDGEFTSEFNNEINDYLGTELNITYSAAIKLVGVSSIDSVILFVAGADGTFVG